MDLKLQPKPEVEILPADRGIVSRKGYFVKKKFEEINQYFFAGHLIRNWKPKAELIYPQVPDETRIQYQCDFNREVQNCFVEDFAEEVFLRTPPPCFVVFGKYNREVNKLCEKLSEEYGSVLIRVDNVVNEVIKKNTETSQLVVRILRLGISLTLNFLLALASYLAHTPEARHRGYVLSGLPCIPISYDLSAEQQFHYLFTWDNKPTFFINVLFNDEDLIKQRTNLRVKLCEDAREKFLKYNSLYQWIPDDDVESDIDDEMLPIKEEPSPLEPDINISPSRQWAQLPGDEESRVWCELEEFDNIIRPVIELISSRVDPQYFITIDSRVNNEFEIIQARLELLQVWRVPEAVPFLVPKSNEEIVGQDEEEKNTEEEEEVEENDEDYLIKQVADKIPQVGFLTLFTKKTLSPKFRWELSHYNYICPVALREGATVEGKTRFAVGFMKYIYFLSDAQSMTKFIKNPRPYVLPIRPKPLCRFIILGHPFSGKTTLAKALAAEFSIPLIDLNKILKDDLKRKKETYQEFCRQKAECLEMIRLTAQAWQDWRMEEERRISLIEEWILYIGNLLRRRIDQFYSGGVADEKSGKESSPREIQSVENAEKEIEGEGSVKSGESSRRQGEKQSLELRGTPVEVSRSSADDQDRSSPSNRLIKAIKHEDFDFNKNGLEVEANLFFSSLWNSFSWEKRHVEKLGKSIEEFGEGGKEYDYEDEPDSLDWCNLLPPQSLSSFLMSKKGFTTRERRQSFKIFLEAASKVYREPSALKSEFAKWRLPCFMDITLCELFLENPVLLLRYIPEWLKERPLIPDPIDPTHPSVLEASSKAFHKAQVVNIKQTPEEVGILLHHAIEKAEREGMRVTGEVISPGGWVVDNMRLDVEVWNKLACEKVFADHIYVLIDTEPDYRRILNIWWQKCGVEQFPEEKSTGSEASENEEKKSRSVSTIITERTKSGADHRQPSESSNESSNVIRMLLDNVKAIREGDAELDTIYKSMMQDSTELPRYLIPRLGSHPTNEKPKAPPGLKKEDSFTDDILSIQSISDTFICTTALSGSKYFPSAWGLPLGSALETVTTALLDFFKQKEKEGDEYRARQEETIECGLEFFYFLLMLPKRLGQLQDWLTSIGCITKMEEIEITGKTPEVVLSDIRRELMAPFIKKPRELENFEIEEIRKSSEEELLNEEGEFEGETFISRGNDEEDVRIFGESGQLCIVNLERDIFLPGKLQHALRYYGKLYYFWNEDAKNKFLEDPEKYAPYYSAIRCYPPLRLFVTGPIGSGKTTLAKELSEQCGIPIVHHPTLLLQNLVPHANFTGMNPLTDESLLLSEDHNAAAKEAKQMFMNAPADKRQFWFESALFPDFIDKSTILDRIRDVQQPVVIRNYPELTYLRVESLPEDVSEGEENENMSKSELVLPQTPYASMKEIETEIIKYMAGNNDLNDYCIERSLKILWTKEPYITQGFVLEGFPLQSSDIKTVIENSWIPDLVLELVVPENEVIERNIGSLMESWVTKLKRETVEEKLLEETLTNIYNTCMTIRKGKLLTEKRAEALEHLGATEMNENIGRVESFEKNKTADYQKKMRSKSAIKNMNYSDYQLFSSNECILPEGVSARIEAEVEEILNKELPPLVFNPKFETYDAGKARIIENIITTYRRNSREIEKIKTSLKEAGVSWLEIDGLKNYKQTQRDLFIRLDKIRKRVMYKGEFAYTLTMEMAEKLLRRGYYFLSKFGRWCPVQVYRMKNPVNMFRPFSARGKVIPIAYRNYIYFVSGDYEKTQFLEDPIKYTFNEPHHPNIPLRIAVIGPPKCGKTTLCKRLGMMFELKVITMGTALRFALEATPTTTLAKSIKSYLKRGCFLPLSLKIEALMLCLNHPSCYTQGFVLDGIPFDAALTQSLAEKGKLPFVIISLVADSDFGKTNRERLDLTQFRLPYKNRTNLDIRYQDWNETYRRFAQWNQDTYNNLYEVNAKLSVVDIFYQAYDIIRKSFFAILYYVEYCISGKVLPLHYLCVSQHEYELRKSSFHNNCPVCWVEKNRLVSSSDPPPRSGLVQYENHFYWICPEDMKKFTNNPKIYLYPYAPKWPEILPKRLSRNVLEADSKLKIHGNGRCPVTRVDFSSSLDWEGSKDFAVSYANEVFLCKNEETLKRFLTQPWRYYKADTVFEVARENKSKAVENLGPPKITSLPPIGFLEQTVASLIHNCLQVLGGTRPIYPNMCPSVTGCTFVGLYLKVYNNKNKASRLEREYLNYMIRSCRAINYKVSFILPVERQRGQGDYYIEKSQESDSSTDSTDSTQCTFSDPKICQNFVDAGKNEKKMWSAKKISDKYVEMKLTEDDELQEIPVHPKTITVLKYEGGSLRPNPIPPISNCLNFIYSVKSSVQIPEKFNYNTLYQTLPAYQSLMSQHIPFNPDRTLEMSLYKRSKTSFRSNANAFKGQRVLSDYTIGVAKEPSVLDQEYMTKHFIPRFKLLEKLIPGPTPPVPRVVPEAPIFYNPHQDYAYTLLFSEFFCTTHVLRFFDLNETQQHLEFSNRLNADLKLTTTKVEYFYKPRVTASERSRTSLDSYQQIFDAASLFAVGRTESDISNTCEVKRTTSESSTYAFMQALLYEKLDELFEDFYYRNLSYDLYDFNVVPVEGKKEIVIQEALPYPPLPWDIICRPYHAYRSITSIFNRPQLDNIAHERQFSLLDGLTDYYQSYRYIHIPDSGVVHAEYRGPRKAESKSQIYFFFDFFNIPWSSFLTYTYSSTFYQEITTSEKD